MVPPKYISGFFFALLGLLIVTPLSHAQPPQQGSQKPMNYEDTAGGVRYLEQGQPPVIIHATVDEMRQFREAHPNAKHAHGGPPAKTSNELDYHGGTSDGAAGVVGVETTPKIYLVLWGSQWNNNDPSGEEAILERFYSAAGESSWLNSVTQYCQGVASGTVFCNGAGAPAGNQAGIYAGTWLDDGSRAPSNPKQSQFAAEAIAAAQHFGNTSAGGNANAQYVIATAHGYNASGFGRQYCAYHSSTSSSTYGDIAYTNLPYITDAGANCGANINGLGPDAGITIVAGHEMAETITDQFPATGWLDGNGEENGDKCAWIFSGQGAVADVTLSSQSPNTTTFPLQSLWSNAYSSDTGGCVMSY